MRPIWGVSALNHDASITVVKDNEILFAAHSERYSRIKNDRFLNSQIVSAARNYGSPQKIIWFEKPLLKKTRQIYAGQYDELKSISPRHHLAEFGIMDTPIHYMSHHESHAAAGYFTSPYNDASIMVVDAIGEWDTASIWKANCTDLVKVQSIKYPNSLGLLYSAMTQRIGLKPNEEEYILMGMAAYGKPLYVDDIMNDFIENRIAPNLKLTTNVHRGIADWRPDLLENEYCNIAASIQKITEKYVVEMAEWMYRNLPSRNLIMMGGVALNCVANEKVARLGLFDNIWIMPNPGDAGSSLGAVCAYNKEYIYWATPYLGTNIVKPFNQVAIVDYLLEHKICGVAHGRSEFGPRSLGNRSLIADPRGDDIKDKVNAIKKRQKFRPFAPMIMEDKAHEYFDMPVKTSPYMQYTAKCLYPDLFPAICHIDGSSRVQTLNLQQNPAIYKLLSEFYNRTGCPMLLNTSLNIRGEPLVDDMTDAIEFQSKYNIKVF